MDLGPLGHQRDFFANGACLHPAAEPITTVDGEHVGYLCPDCDTALPLHRTPRFDLSSTALSGVAAYWVEDGAHLARASAAATLISAGMDPLDALEVTGHAAEACPQRAEVTSLSDATPQYVHGGCQPEDKR